MQIGDLVVDTSRGDGHDHIGIIVAKGHYSDPHSAYLAYWDVLFPDGVSRLNELWLRLLEAADAKG
jgi:hypothetical protein